MTKNVSILTIFFLFGCAGLPIGSVDSQGETGPAGPIGPIGPAGPRGEKGKDGKSVSKELIEKIEKSLSDLYAADQMFLLKFRYLLFF